MKGLCIIAAISFLPFTASFAQPHPDRIIGIYLTPNKDGRIAVYKKGDFYFGKLIAAQKNFKDLKNPNPQLRTRDIVGADFMLHFKHNNGEYINGEIYDARSGKTYDCKMWLDGSNLKVRGFMGLSLFGMTETFIKAG